MKRTTKSSDFRIASSDMSHRTLKEIQKGEPKRKPAPYQPGLTGSKPISTISSFDFELGKKQAEKLMAAQQAAKLKASLKP